MTCRYPDHHEGGRSGVIVLGVLVAAAAVWSARRLVAEVLTVAAVVLGALVVIVLVVIIARMFHRAVPSRPAGGNLEHRNGTRVPWLRHVPRAVWAAARWHHLARNLGLAAPDKHHQGKVRHPRAVILPDSHGIVARVRTVPGTGRAELDQAAEHIGNYWHVARVSVSQPKPGRLVVRGLKRDPLLEQFGLGIESPASDSVRRLFLGRDEHGTDRYADLANCPGIVVGGMPGSGKSTEITAWLAQLAPSPAVQFALADGKNAGEYDDFTGRAYVMAGDDLDDVLHLLEAQHGLMTDRLASVRPVLGVKNAWHRGPSEAWGLAVTVLDECQSYLDLAAVKGDKVLEPKVRRAIFLTSSLIRRGRSVMMLTIAATQKPTTDSLPSSIRDNCPIAMSFAVRTVDAAAASLGSAIRDFPSCSPAGLALPEYTGVATVTLRDGLSPFSRLRGPWVSEDQAAAVAASSAPLRRDPRVSLPVVVPDDARELTAS